MSFESIKQIVDTSAFNLLVGRNEDEWFEAKQNPPYDFDTAAGRYELAKDVCAFANAQGGFILVGLTTIFADAVKSETVTGIQPFPQVEFSVPQYEGLIREHTYPTIKGLRIAWMPAAPSAALGIGVIEIPPQIAKQKYFLTAKVVEGDSQLKEIVFGLSRRNSASNSPMSIDELHRLMQNGKNPVPETLIRLEEKLDALLHTQLNPEPPVASAADLLNERINRILSDKPEPE